MDYFSNQEKILYLDNCVLLDNFYLRLSDIESVIFLEI